MLFVLYHIWAVVIWIFIGLLLFGIGDLFNKLFSLKNIGWFKTIWLGLFYTIFILQIIHIFFPINTVILILFTIISFSWLVYNYRRTVIRSIQSMLKSNWGNYGLWIILGLIVITIFSNLSYTQNILHDSGLYYLPTNNWIITEKIVFGLGNLHGRFGFNNSSFLFSGLISNLPGTGEEWRFVSGSFVMITLMKSVLSFIQVTKKKKPSIHTLYYALLTVIIIFYALIANGRNLAIFSPDILVFLIELILFGEILKVLSRKLSQSETIFILLLATLLITIKLSGIIFAILISIIAIYNYFINNKQKNWRDIMYTISLALILILTWMTRGTMLTGYPLYPQGLIHFNVPWVVSSAQVKDMVCWISGWAKQPYLSSCLEVNSNQDWISVWFESFMKDSYFMISLGTSFVLMITNLIFFTKKYFKFFLLQLFIIIPTILFWFYTAPDTRFILAISIVLLVSSIAFSIYVSNKKVIFAGIIMLILISSTLIEYVEFHSIEDLKLNTEEKVVDYETLETKSGDNINIPLSGDQCWNTETPCTPYFDENITVDNNGYWKIITTE